MSEKPIPDQNIATIGPLPWREATQTVRDAVASLLAADAAQRKHQSIKPAKPMRSATSGMKFIDFGVARFVDNDSVADSITGVRIGSSAYMSPERCRSHRTDARSDLYALTCCYYELLTGELPFKAADVATLLYEHCYTPFPDATAKVPGLPDGVRRVLARGSEKDPDARYQSAAEMVADLTTLLATSGTPGKSTAAARLFADMPAGAVPVSTGKRNVGLLVALAIAGALVVLAIVGVGIVLYHFRDEWNPGSPPAAPVKAIAPAPRYAAASIPSATQETATTDPVLPTSAPSSPEKVIPVPAPRDMAAYLRELGIVDRFMLERGAQLRAFEFTRPIPPNEWPTVVAQMEDVEYITFHNQSGTDEAVAQVAKVPTLIRLSLGSGPVTDKGITFLKGHQSLQRLDLAYTAISGAAIADLASIPNLTALDLRKTAVRGPCWKPLQDSRVSSLWLAGNPIEDQDLADLAGHRSLSMIQLSNTHVTDAVIDTLATMPNFRQGDFAETRIDDAGVRKLGRMQNLVTLELSGCPIGENGLAPLANLKNLRRLEIRNLVLSDAAMGGITEGSQVEGLDLGGSRFSASGLSALGRLSKLRSLKLDGAKIESPGGSAIIRRMLDDLNRKLPDLRIVGTPEETPGR